MSTGIGQFIIRRRDELNLTQTALAEMVGLKRSHLSLIESGKIALPGAGVRREIARVLGVRHVDLLVIAGELSPDEIESLHESTVVDFRLREIIDAWPDILPEAQAHLHSLLRVPGIVVREVPQVSRLAR